MGCDRAYEKTGEKVCRQGGLIGFVNSSVFLPTQRVGKSCRRVG